jgi:bacterial/archaeal transporter family-2 protein
MKSDARLMAVFAPLVGGLLTVMSGVNTRLSAATGTPVALVVIHLAGLAGISLVLLARREERLPGRIPAPLWLGGAVGVGTVFCTVYAFSALGASLAVALALLGQTSCSVAIDAVGFLGRRRRPLTLRRLPGLLVAGAGACVIAGSWRMNAPAVILAFVSGVLPALTMSTNAELARRLGLARSTLANYVTGLAASLLVVLAVRPSPAAAVEAVKAAGPFLALGGGLMGMAVVLSTNWLFPRMPAFTATLLLYTGQALMGVIVEAAAAGCLDARKLAGTLVLLAGLVLDGLLDRLKPGAAPAA